MASCKLSRPHFDFLREQARLFKPVMHNVPERCRFLDSFHLAWQITFPMEKPDWMDALDLKAWHRLLGRVSGYLLLATILIFLLTLGSRTLSNNVHVALA